MHTKPSLLNPTHGNSSNLDFIRSVAVLAVVLRHILGEWHIETLGPLRVQLLGIFGVMLFFVLTAHVLMLSLQRLQAAQPAGLAWRFLVQRFFRIYPLSVLVVLIGWAFSPPGFIPLDGKQTVINLLLLQDFTDWVSAIGPLWSLPIEVQMYLFLPAVFTLLGRGRRMLLLVYAGSVPLALAAFKLPLPEVLCYLPCFVPGALAYGIMRHMRPQANLPFWVLPVILLGAFGTYTVLGRWSETVGAYPACLIIGLCIPYVRECASRTINATCAVIAKYSYGIYLVHAPSLAVCFSMPVAVPVQLLAFASMTALLAWLSHRLIESPFIRLGKALTATARTRAPLAA